MPPGTYAVSYQLSGFSRIRREAVTVALGLVVEVNVTMRAAGVTETVQVVAETPAPIATPILGANLKHVDQNGLRTGYVNAATFGTNTSAAQFIPLPLGGTGLRTFAVAMGLRF